MTEISNIRNLYFEEGKSITEINRITGKDRKTIKHYIDKDDWNKPEESEKIEKTFPKLEPYKAEIDKWLTDDKKAKKKQRHTAKRVFNRLVEEYGDGFDCSYRTIAGYFSVRKKEIFSGENGYIPLEHIAGEQMNSKYQRCGVLQTLVRPGPPPLFPVRKRPFFIVTDLAFL